MSVLGIIRTVGAAAFYQEEFYLSQQHLELSDRDAPAEPALQGECILVLTRCPLHNPYTAGKL